MPKHSPVKANLFLKILKKFYGCEFIAIRGSHLKVVRGNLHSTIVIKETELRPDQVRYVLQDLQIGWKEFKKYL